MITNQSIVNKLKAKATAAREKLEHKAQHEQDCDMYEDHMIKGYKIASIARFLAGFNKNGTLDLRPEQYFRDVNINLREANKTEYIFLQDKHEEYDLDKKWMKAQNDYIRSLTTESLFNIYGYSYNGDTFVNNYLRNTFNIDEFKEYLKKLDITSQDYFPLFFPAVKVLSKFGKESMSIVFDDANPSDKAKEAFMHVIDKTVTPWAKYNLLLSFAHMLSYERFWISVIETYISDIQAIINGAPATTSPMVVYRGVESDYFLTKFMTDHRNRVHVANSFVSTTSSVHVANEYASHDTQCCFMRIYVPVGSKMLLMAGCSRFSTEAEFLLGHRTQFYITKSRTEKFCTNTYDLNMRVTDLVMIM